MSSGAAQWGQFLALQARVKALDGLGLDTITAAGLALLDDADASAQLTTLGVSTFIKTLLDDTSAALALATLGITTGSYTPTLFNTTNVAASTAQVTYWKRTLDRVDVHGRVDIDPTAAGGTFTVLGMSLPVASNFATGLECNGTAAASVVNSSASISGDAANDRALIRFASQDLNNTGFTFHFSYLVI